MPQYQLAIGKIRVKKFMPFMMDIVQAQQVYYLANGEYTAYYDKLDVTIPEGGKTCEGTAGYNCKDFGNWSCIVSGGTDSGGINCRDKVVGVSISRSFGKSSENDYWACWAGDVDSLSDKICKALAQGTSVRSTYGSYRLNNF